MEGRDMKESRHCPRCGGRILIERETDGLSLNCLQCGYNKSLVLAVPRLHTRYQHQAGHHVGVKR